MNRTIRGLIMFTLALCVVFDCITKQVDIWYFSVYFFIQLILIWWAIEDKGGINGKNFISKKSRK